MEILDKYNDVRQQLFDAVGYVEGWRVLPVDDARDYFWHLTGEGYGDAVLFAKEVGNVHNGTMQDGYCNEIYTQRHLPRWVYRGNELTMIVVDTNVDGNKLIQFFDNTKEVE